MKILEIYECPVHINDKSQFKGKTDIHPFVEKYIYFWLGEQSFDDGGVYIPQPRKDKQRLTVVVHNDSKKIYVTINDVLHISVVLQGFHHMQCICELYSTSHALFFSEAHNEKIAGVTLLSDLYWINRI